MILAKLKADNDDQRVGIQIVRKAISAPDYLAAKELQEKLKPLVKAKEKAMVSS